MKTTPKVSILFMVSLLALTVGCKKDEAAPEFELNNAPFTGSFTWTTKSQTIAANAGPENLVFKVVVEGKGDFSFAKGVTIYDEFDFNASTGAGKHKATWTATNGDKIMADVSTQIDPKTGQILGTTTFTGGTGRFAKVNGTSVNSGGSKPDNSGGTWEEKGTITF